MARLLTTGFELNATAGGSNFPDGSINSSTPTIVTSPVRTGTYALQCDRSVGIEIWQLTGPTGIVNGTTYFMRAYVRFVTLPDADDYILGQGSSGATRSGIGFTTSGGVNHLVLRTGTIASYEPAAATDTEVKTGIWYLVEYSFKYDTGALDDFTFRLNGVTVVTQTGLNITDSPSALCYLGFMNGATLGTVVFDDVAINDSSGSDQNSWPGEGRVALLKPISDNAGGTGWVLGANTALGGNGFGSLDNTPPLGVADLAVGSDPKQIRNATAAANSNYDANLTTYTTAGIGATDKVNVVQPLVATAAPVTTSAKAGTIGIASNPAISNVALSATGTPGAFWQGNTAGTWPTGWKWSLGTTTYAPSVTVGTSPVARVTQVTSSTRIAMVCALGMYVDYTPAPSLVFPTTRPTRYLM